MLQGSRVSRRGEEKESITGKRSRKDEELKWIRIGIGEKKMKMSRGGDADKKDSRRGDKEKASKSREG